METESSPRPLSATAIAKKIGRKPCNVTAAIARLKIEAIPSLIPVGNYYQPEAIPVIEAGMRRRNAPTQD